MRLSLRDRLLASVDPVRGRRLLDRMECGAVRRGRRSRRLSARLLPPGSKPFERWLAERGYDGMNRQVENAFGREQG